MLLRTEATKVAALVESDVGIDPVTIVTIITTLLPMFLKCFQQSSDSTSESPKDFLTAHYDESTETFDQYLIERSRARTRVAARKNGQRHLSRDQLDSLTVASFKHAIESDDATVAACMDEASRIADDLE